MTTICANSKRIPGGDCPASWAAVTANRWRRKRSTMPMFVAASVASKPKRAARGRSAPSTKRTKRIVTNWPSTAAQRRLINHSRLMVARSRARAGPSRGGGALYSPGRGSLASGNPAAGNPAANSGTPASPHSESGRAHIGISPWEGPRRACDKTPCGRSRSPRAWDSSRRKAPFSAIGQRVWK